MKRLVPSSFAFLFMALTSDAFARRSGLMVVEEIVAFEIRVVSLPPSPDFSGNGVVGLEDFFAFAEVYGSVDGDGIYQAKFDLSRNGSIGLEDFFIFAESFGMEVGTSSPPPDPPAGLAPADQAAFDSLGLPEDVIFLRANEHTPAQLSAMIAEKLGAGRFDGKASEVPPPRMTSPTGEVVFDYSCYNGRYVIGSGMLEFETAWTKASNTCIHVYNDSPSINGVAMARGCASISQVLNAGLLDYTSRTRTPSLGEIVVLRNKKGFYAAIHLLRIKDDSRGDDRDELRFRYVIQSNGSDSFAEFVDM